MPETAHYFGSEAQLTYEIRKAGTIIEITNSQELNRVYGWYDIYDQLNIIKNVFIFL